MIDPHQLVREILSLGWGPALLDQLQALHREALAAPRKIKFEPKLARCACGNPASKVEGPEGFTKCDKCFYEED